MRTKLYLPSSIAFLSVDSTYDLGIQKIGFLSNQFRCVYPEVKLMILLSTLLQKKIKI